MKIHDSSKSLNAAIDAYTSLDGVDPDCVFPVALAHSSEGTFWKIHGGTPGEVWISTFPAGDRWIARITTQEDRDLYRDEMNEELPR